MPRLLQAGDPPTSPLLVNSTPFDASSSGNREDTLSKQGAEWSRLTLARGRVLWRDAGDTRREQEIEEAMARG